MRASNSTAAFLLGFLMGSGAVTQTAYADKTDSSVIAADTSAQQAVDEALQTLTSSNDSVDILRALAVLEVNWDDQYIAPLLDLLSVPRNNFTPYQIIQLLTDKTGQNFQASTNDWFFWLWNQPEQIASNYGDFKAGFYKQIDSRFEKYFAGRQSSSRIRLDEIRWGGVLQDGIPPLRHREMISAKEATYLQDDNIVFGIAHNGDFRAYPKRILAWHEMFIDTIGGEEIAGVYCTLCGTVIPYKTTFNGVKHTLGTSGFLYRSNKLMYDQATQSLWSTTKGEPVVGPLVGKGIALEHIGVVTTTWGEWKRRHPETRVLSLSTGHMRNYGEGVAYKEYFSTDELMFNTPYQDDRLANKQEVLALRFPAAPEDQLAIDTEFLNKNPIYRDQIGFQKVLVLTDKSGANRVYDPEDIDFVSYDQDSQLIDSQGRKWQLEEHRLIAETGQQLSSLPYRRAFWFGWHAVFPETRLIK